MTIQTKKSATNYGISKYICLNSFQKLKPMHDHSNKKISNKLWHFQIHLFEQFPKIKANAWPFKQKNQQQLHAHTHPFPSNVPTNHQDASHKDMSYLRSRSSCSQTGLGGRGWPPGWQICKHLRYKCTYLIPRLDIQIPLEVRCFFGMFSGVQIPNLPRCLDVYRMVLSVFF